MTVLQIAWKSCWATVPSIIRKRWGHWVCANFSQVSKYCINHFQIEFVEYDFWIVLYGFECLIKSFQGLQPKNYYYFPCLHDSFVTIWNNSNTLQIIYYKYQLLQNAIQIMPLCRVSSSNNLILNSLQICTFRKFINIFAYFRENGCIRVYVLCMCVGLDTIFI